MSDENKEDEVLNVQAEDESPATPVETSAEDTPVPVQKAEGGAEAPEKNDAKQKKSRRKKADSAQEEEEPAQKTDDGQKSEAPAAPEPQPKALKRPGLNVLGSYERLQSSVPALIFAGISAFVIMLLVAVAVFFMNLHGAEQVLVPNVVGKKWDEALLEMQTKELYARINLRYSEQIGDEDTVLEQSPEAGAIVKGYSRVDLVISRGVVVDEVGDYVGKNLSEVQMSLQTLFAGQTKPLITLDDVEYIPDTAEAGTILEQNPPAGYKISQPVTVQLVVSRGPAYENTRRPYVIGQSVNDLLQTIARSKLVFDITSHIATDGETPGTVVNQQRISSEYVPNYSRVTVEMAMPANAVGENTYGIFQAQLPEYPYPVPMRLTATPSEGEAYTILNFSHPGGNVTIPYFVSEGTVLTLYVNDRVMTRQTVD